MIYTEEDIAAAVGLGIGFMAGKHSVPQPEVHEMKEIFKMAITELHKLKQQRESEKKD